MSSVLCTSLSAVVGVEFHFEACLRPGLMPPSFLKAAQLNNCINVCKCIYVLNTPLDITNIAHCRVLVFLISRTNFPVSLKVLNACCGSR